MPATGKLACGWATISAMAGWFMAISASLVRSTALLVVLGENPLASAIFVLINPSVFVNGFTNTLGLINTNIADASGFSPKTTSNAVDLTKLAEIAMNHPAIAEIVAQPQANL